MRGLVKQQPGDAVWTELNAECGMGNAEFPWRVVPQHDAHTYTHSAFRIPHSALGFHRAPHLPPRPLLRAPLLLLRFLDRGPAALSGPGVCGSGAGGGRAPGTY